MSFMRRPGEAVVHVALPNGSAMEFSIYPSDPVRSLAAIAAIATVTPAGTWTVTTTQGTTNPKGPNANPTHSNATGSTAGTNERRPPSANIGEPRTGPVAVRKRPRAAGSNPRRAPGHRQGPGEHAAGVQVPGD